MFVVYLIWFQSPFYFPKPTGRYSVGVKTYHWVDTSRKETLANDPIHPNRELMVNVWYPAKNKSPEKPTTPYAPYIVDFCKKNQKIVWLLAGLSRPIYSYAQPKALLAQDEPRYPVIIFSHGFGVTRDGNTAHCEELASHGYVVVGISHTYDASIVQFPDGRIADGFKSIEKRFRKLEKYNDLEKQMHQAIEPWISDVHFVLDQLEKLTSNNASIFYQRFDQENIGIFGHSMGGATAIQICRRDARVKAGVNLDGSLFGSDVTKKFDKPCMFMLSEDTVKIFERPWTRNDWKNFIISSQDEEKKFKAIYLPAIKELTQSIGHDVYTFVVKNAGHADFCDNAFGNKSASLCCRILVVLGAGEALAVGKINGFRATKIVNAYLVNFFDKYLKGKPSELLDGGSKPYAEIEAKQWINQKQP